MIASGRWSIAVVADATASDGPHRCRVRVGARPRRRLLRTGRQPRQPPHRRAPPGTVLTFPTLHAVLADDPDFTWRRPAHPAVRGSAVALTVLRSIGRGRRCVPRAKPKRMRLRLVGLSSPSALRYRAGMADDLCLLQVHAHPDDEASKGAGTTRQVRGRGRAQRARVLHRWRSGRHPQPRGRHARGPRRTSTTCAWPSCDASVDALGYASLHMLGYHDSGHARHRDERPARQLRQRAARRSGRSGSCASSAPSARR